MAEQSNPYAAPKAQVQDVDPHQAGNFTPEGRKLSAGRGWAWIAEGFSMFMRAPGTWIGLMLVWLILMIVVGLIPFVGSIITSLFFAVFMAGIMAGCKALQDEDGLRVGHLFAGFSMNIGQLILIGLLYLVGIIIAAVIAGVIFYVLGGVGLFVPGAGGGPGMGTIALVALLVLALFMPVVMAIWFAPALTGLNGMSAMQALGASFKGCLKNVVPFLVWGLVFFAILMVVLLIIVMVGGGGAMMSRVGVDGGGMGSMGVGMLVFAGLLYLLFALVIGPVTLASMYASYRDIYYED
jgi:hypothetical protein